MWKLLSGKKPKRNVPRADTSDKAPETDTEHSKAAQRPRLLSGKNSKQNDIAPAETSDKPHKVDAVHPETARGHTQVSEEPAMVSIEDLEEEDVVIAVMGPTGSGKRTFICRASGRDDTRAVGHTLRTWTTDVRAIRYFDQKNGRHVVLVDTPGFNGTYTSDLEILGMISSWLDSSYKKDKLLAGILYLHRITDNRMAGTPLKNLRAFQRLCGRGALDKVYLTTTMWDEVERSAGERRLAELRREYWEVMVSQGAQVACCRNDDDSPKGVIQRILDQESRRRAVPLQEEMSKRKLELKETEAERELYSHLERLAEKQVILLQRIDKERRAGSDASALAALQAEYKDSRVLMDFRLREIHELRLSQSKITLRFFSRK